MFSWSGLHPLQWRHNERDGVSNHQPHDRLLNHLFRCRSQKTSKLRLTGLCVGNSPVTGEFPAQMASNAENVSIWWRHHDHSVCKCPETWRWQALSNHPPDHKHFHDCLFQFFWKINYWRYALMYWGGPNSYGLLIPSALKISTVYKKCTFRCMGTIFCVEFQRYHLKCQTKYLTHTLKDMYFAGDNRRDLIIKSSKAFLISVTILPFVAAIQWQTSVCHCSLELSAS